MGDTHLQEGRGKLRSGAWRAEGRGVDGRPVALGVSPPVQAHMHVHTHPSPRVGQGRQEAVLIRNKTRRLTVSGKEK